MSDRSPRFRLNMESLEAREVPAATPMDAAYLIRAEQGDVQEILIGLQAMQHGSTPATRQFGQILVQDHYAALIQLVPLAQSEGIPFQWISKDQQNVVDHFQHLRGNEFDREFASFMVQDHQQDIALANMEASTTTDAQLRTYALSTLPMLQLHYQIAQLDDRAFNHGHQAFHGDLGDDNNNGNND